MLLEGGDVLLIACLTDVGHRLLIQHDWVLGRKRNVFTLQDRDHALQNFTTLLVRLLEGVEISWNFQTASESQRSSLMDRDKKRVVLCEDLDLLEEMVNRNDRVEQHK